MKSVWRSGRKLSIFWVPSQPALSPDPPGSDRDFGLDHGVTRPPGIAGGIQKDQEAVLLIILEKKPESGRRDGEKQGQ